ncbi:MAG: site-2 protease family protein [Deltaproteobacteria bacterium]|nr:site-2 protease family protein [Deltaproteobacteria bacterium]MBW1871000.1 site-2 protease family protein [Deltaproteobacteria bacterium]
MASLFWFIVLIGILIFAHEGGHFTFAKLFKVKVLTFSLGFGTPIRLGKFKLSFKPGETEYRIAWFPIGGFVRMLGDDPSEEIPVADQPRAFSTQKAWKRFLIIFGGPLFSVLLAVPIYFVFHLVQDTAPAPIVGRVVPGSPAALAGIHPNDRVFSIAGFEVETFEDIDSGIQSSAGQAVKITVERAGKKLSFDVKPVPELDETGLELLGQRWDAGLKYKRQGNIIGVVKPDSPAVRSQLQCWDRILEVGGIPVEGWWDAQYIMEGNGKHLLPVTVVRAAHVEAGAVTVKTPALMETFVRPDDVSKAPEGTLHTKLAYFGIEPIDLYIGEVSEGLPADRNGLVAGDKIISVGGQPIFSWEQFSLAVAEQPDDMIRVQIRHAGSLRNIEFKPEVITQTNEFKQKIRKLGLGVSYMPNTLFGQRIARPDRFLYASKMAFVDTGNAISMNIIGFVRIFQGRVKPSEAIGGPLMIADIAGKSAEKGWQYFVQMMAFLTTLLGILNLLPIPILDGGHIAFILIEVLIRRPVSIKTRVVSTYIGLILLAGLMIFALGNDIHRYWS